MDDRYKCCGYSFWLLVNYHFVVLVSRRKEKTMVQRYDPNNPFREIKEAFPNQITTDWKAMYEVLKECNTALERERDELLQKVQVLENDNALLRKRLEVIKDDYLADKIAVDCHDNCHDELVAALKMLIRFIPDGWPMPLGYSQVVAQAETAIAKVKNQPPDLTAGEFNRGE
jgi:hypothetical protein